MKLKVQNNTNEVNLASPLADLGVGPRVTVYEVTDVPGEATFQEVLAMFTAATWVASHPRFVFGYDELIAPSTGEIDAPPGP